MALITLDEVRRHGEVAKLREMLQYAYHRHKHNYVRDMSNYASGATGDEIGRLLADQHGNKGRDPEELKAKWVTSENFVPMTVPTEAVHPVRVPSGNSHSKTVGPIVIEDNFRNVEQKDGHNEEGNGFIPATVIIDGQHRWFDAMQAKQPTIQAIVGEKAIPKINRMVLRHRMQERFRRSGDVQKLSLLLSAEYSPAVIEQNATLAEPDADKRTELLGFVNVASPECRAAGRVCEHCAHWRYNPGTCGLFKILGLPDHVAPDSYCEAFI